MKLYLSYSYMDRVIADKVTKIIMGIGYDVITNELKEEVSNIIYEIRTTMQSADMIIAIITENYMNSSWSQAELSAAILGMNKKILAIVIGNVPLPSYLSGIVYYKVNVEADIDINELKKSIAYLAAFSNSIVQSKSDYANENLNTKIQNLKKAIGDNRLTLVCGAGISVDAGISNWQTLLVKILDKSIIRLGKNNLIDVNGIDIKVVEKQLSSSSLILGKYLKNVLGADFEKEVKNALYSTEIKESKIIKMIIELIRPQRNKGSVESVITFNFDSLLEDTLNKNCIKNKAIYEEAMQYEANEIPIYHVHGYLPREEDIDNPNLVFSEDAYHTQFIDPYSWTNLIQLYKYSNNICLFIGLSLTDPNLRRLLDIARRKNGNGSLKHYVIKKMPLKQTTIDKIELILEEQDANLLGLNVVWVSDYNDIPFILKRLIE